MRLRILCRDAKPCLRERARARARIPFQKPIFFLSRRCNSINSFVVWHRSPRRGEQCYGCRAFLHRVRIALGVTTRGCGTTAPGTFPCRRRRINRCSRNKKKGSGKGNVKKRIESSAMAKRYISDAIVIGERRAAFSILRVRRRVKIWEPTGSFAFQIMRSDIRFNFTRKMFNFTLTNFWRSLGNVRKDCECAAKIKRCMTKQMRNSGNYYTSNSNNSAIHLSWVSTFSADLPNDIVTYRHAFSLLIITRMLSLLFSAPSDNCQARAIVEGV